MMGKNLLIHCGVLSVMASPNPAELSPVLYLTEQDVRQLLPMSLALEAVEAGLRKMALDEAHLIPRQRVVTDHAVLHSMGAAAKSLGYMGTKVYSTTRKGHSQFLVTLFHGKTGQLLALIQADVLGQIRTGAASGLASRVMARPDASEVGILGSGKQARTQLEAVCLVREVQRVSVYSPTPEHRQAFAIAMSQHCGVEVVPVARPEDAVRGKDIVITATTSREPVLQGQWLAPGTHVNAIGSNMMGRTELDVESFRRCADVIVDSKDQARSEAGDFQQAIEEGVLHWSDIRELGQVLLGRYAVRKQAPDITIFKSLGIAIEDIAVAGRVYERAKEAGVGQTLVW
jgi:ornithine cyclodeaminase/alanine dehydrogenase-like protein (mu-crystallin family)